MANDVTDFEASGMNGWSYLPPSFDDQGYGISTSQYHSASNGFHMAGGDSGDPDYNLENVGISKTYSDLSGGSMTFWARGSDAYDSYMYVEIDGTTVLGPVLLSKTGFQQYTVTLPSGSHTISIWSDWISNGGVNGSILWLDDITVPHGSAAPDTTPFFMVV